MALRKPVGPAVLAEVSSMNTSRAGSNMPCSCIQRRRARATSARDARRGGLCDAQAQGFRQPHGGWRFFQRHKITFKKSAARGGAGAFPSNLGHRNSFPPAPMPGPYPTNRSPIYRTFYDDGSGMMAPLIVDAPTA